MFDLLANFTHIYILTPEEKYPQLSMEGHACHPSS